MQIPRPAAAHQHDTHVDDSDDDEGTPDQVLKLVLQLWEVE